MKVNGLTERNEVKQKREDRKHLPSFMMSEISFIMKKA